MGLCRIGDTTNYIRSTAFELSFIVDVIRPAAQPLLQDATLSDFLSSFSVSVLAFDVLRRCFSSRNHL